MYYHNNIDTEDTSPESVGLYDEHRMMVQIPRDEVESQSGTSRQECGL